MLSDAYRLHPHLKVLAVTMLCLTSCTGSPGSFGLSGASTRAHHLAIAHYHQSEAVRLRQKADTLYAHARVYARVFGADSEWTHSTRLLAETYLDGAEEQTRLAADYLHSTEGLPPVRTTAP
jgi:hypothetical protein